MGGYAERETGFEPATSTLARLHSTTELFPHKMRAKGIEPPRLSALDPKSSVSASSTTLARKLVQLSIRPPQITSFFYL